MIIISLKALLLCGLVLIAGVALLRACAATPPDQLDLILGAIPLGALICTNGRLRRANRPAQALLRQHPGLESLVVQLSIEITAHAAVCGGALALPYSLRWWGSRIDARHTLIILLNASDEQAILARQQQFVGQLSHELRTPLTALTAHAEIALREHTNSDVLHASLHIIQRETRRSARLVRDLIELYRLEVSGQLSLRKTKLVLVAEAAIAQVILHAEQRGQHLRFNADADLPQIWADPDRMTQVFVNLLQNAVTHTRTGDTIVVNLLRHDGGVLCEVVDTGPGIAEVDLPHVIERLYRGQGGGEGSGLGLAIVSEILRQHGTTLEISSTTTSQTGTACRWVLPGAEPAAPAQRAEFLEAPV